MGCRLNLLVALKIHSAEFHHVKRSKHSYVTDQKISEDYLKHTGHGYDIYVLTQPSRSNNPPPPIRLLRLVSTVHMLVSSGRWSSLGDRWLGDRWLGNHWLGNRRFGNHRLGDCGLGGHSLRGKLGHASNLGQGAAKAHQFSVAARFDFSGFLTLEQPALGEQPTWGLLACHHRLHRGRGRRRRRWF
jgi:hypothetical protein